MHFHDEKGQPLQDVLRESTALLEEGKTYRLKFQLEEDERQGWRGWLGELELKWEPTSASFTVRTGYWVGTQALRIHDPRGKEQRLSVEVRPRKTKLEEEAWAQLLRDLDTWMPGSTLGQEGGRHGSVNGHQGCEIMGVASTLGDIVPAFVSALSALMRTPQERSAEYRTEIPVHAVRQADRDTLRWLVRHPQIYQGISGRSEEEDPGALVPARGVRGSLDHPANRSVVWLTRQAIARLRDTAHRIRQSLGKRKNQSLDPDLKHWCEGRAVWLTEGADALEALLRRAPWSSLPAEPVSPSAQLTLLGNPIYARVHAIAQIFRSPRFQLPEDDGLINAPVRPSYELYELWTFFALRQLLEPLVPGAEWTEQGVTQLRCFEQDARGAHYLAHLAGRGTLELHFNLSFSGYLNKTRERHHPWSISSTRRPDLVVAWTPTGEPGRWVCLDAKYRTDRKNVEDAFKSVHLYRDSLRWKGAENRERCRGAVLLIPALHEELKPWSEPSFRDEHAAGIFCLTPGQAPSTELMDWLRERLALPDS